MPSQHNYPILQNDTRPLFRARVAAGIIKAERRSVCFGVYQVRAAAGGIEHLRRATTGGIDGNDHGPTRIINVRRHVVRRVAGRGPLVDHVVTERGP